MKRVKKFEKVLPKDKKFQIVIHVFPLSNGHNGSVEMLKNFIYKRLII